MIKRMLIVISTMLFAFVVTAQDIYIQIGDIALWMPVGVEKTIAAIRCPQLPFYYHADIIYDNSGNVITSAPPEGCGATSSLDDRMSSGKWSKLAILRNESLTESELNAVLDTAFSLQCNYDWIGFYLQWFDFLLSCSEIEFFRIWADLIPDLNCLSFAAYCHNFPNPHRITPWGMIATPGWKIVDEYNLEEL